MAKPKRNSSLSTKRTQQQPQQGQVVKAASYQGPIPPPKALEDYERTLPGAAERILSMAERQAQHRQHIESKVIQTESRNSLWGLISGFLIGMTAIIAGAYCMIQGHEVGGTILGGTGLTSLVGVFVYGSRQRRIEREKHA